MIDREKVIKEFEKICEYTLRPHEFRVLNDVLALLKEQEPVKPVRDKETGRLWLCSSCGCYVGFEDNDEDDPNEFNNFCSQCGRMIDWNDRC